MALQMSVTLRNALLDQIETTIGTGAKLNIRTTAQPADCAAANTGASLVLYTLASDWAAAASGGTKAWSGTPIAGTAEGTGTAAHFRLFASNGTTCHMQGSVTVTSGGGDIEIDNTSINTGQSVNVTGWTWTAPGA